MPEMPSFYRDWHHRGFEILALPVEDNPPLVAAFMKKKGVYLSRRHRFG